MHKQQASLFVAYKGQLFTNHCHKKNQSNQHSVHIKSALIINFTQPYPGNAEHDKALLHDSSIMFFSFQDKLSFNSTHVESE